MSEEKSPLLVKKLRKYETLVLESARGRIEIVVESIEGSVSVLNIYAPLSVKISSTMDRQDQYMQLNASKDNKAKKHQKDVLAYFAAGNGRVDN